MMKKAFYLLVGVLCAFSIRTIYAQQEPVTNHYLYNTYSLSPAFAGTSSKGDLFINYRKEGLHTPPPETYRANAFFPVARNMFIGAEVYKDQIDIFEQFKATLSYTYRLQMASQQFLHFGIWGYMVQNTYDLTKIIGDIDDPLLLNLTQSPQLGYNTGFSLLYINRDLQIGFGIPTLIPTDSVLRTNQETPSFNQTYLFHASNLYDLSSNIQLMPMIVVQRTTNQPTMIDVSASLIFGEKFWLTGMYRTSKTMVLGVGGELFNTLNLYYTYDIGIGGLQHRSGGTHEITLGFKFGKKQMDDVREYKRPSQDKQKPIKPKTQKQKNKRYMLHDYQQLYEQKYRRN